MTRKSFHAIAACAVLLSSCATPGPDRGASGDSGAAAGAGLAAAWVSGAAEYAALTHGVYRSARDDLSRLLADPAWNALPEYPARAGLAPAIILDVDETVLDNSPYQVAERGVYDPATWDAWIASRAAPALPGAVEFLRAAREAGAVAFFVTNRRCKPRGTIAGRCPQADDTLRNLESAGIVTDADHLMLRDEQADWTSEKSVRRAAIAAGHRVVMLFGDDLADFLSCVRGDVVPPCTQAASRQDRLRRASAPGTHWGNGWYMLPNPMYGSWTEVR